VPIIPRVRTPALTRRILAVALVASAGLATLAFAIAVVAGGGSGTQTTSTALVLHPVAGSFEPDATTLESCDGDDPTCIEQAFGNIAYYEGPRRAIAVLEQEVDPDSNGCHRIVHSIGSASLARFDGNVGRTFAQGTSNCFSGYYHGVLERSLVNASSYGATALTAVSRRICDDPGVRALADLEYQCLHGLGHGLMITTGYDLPLSLHVCGRMDGEWEQTSCEGGALMENISTSYGVRSRWVRDDDPVYPCNAIRDQAKRTCYQLVTSRILQVVGVDWERTAEICGSVEQRWVRSCFQSFGRDVSGQTRRNAEEIAEICTLARDYGHEVECIRFAAMDMVLNYARGDEAAVLCDRTGASLQAPCYQAIGAIMGRSRASAAERAADCRALKTIERNVRACIRGANTRLDAAVGE
jgi:hypothetical protein